MEEEKILPYSELTGNILACCFEVMKELGPGFLEKVYRNALMITLQQKGLQIQLEQPFTVTFRGQIIGRYYADLIVNQTVIVELKCCDGLAREHQAQLFNYLKISSLPVGLLVNFRYRKLEWKRLQSNQEHFDIETSLQELPLL